ncbi:MAG: class I SAM-dependent methyltransferase [Chthoniobacterales bacterium]
MKTQFIRNRDEWILARCRGRRVLHLGCTDWPLTRERLSEGRLLHGQLAAAASELVGVDPDHEGIDGIARAMPGFEFACLTAEDMAEDPRISGRKWDVVLAADVLEHVSDVGRALAAMRRVMGPDSELLLTTPSAFALKRFAALLFQGREHVHPDHCYYFSPSTLHRCLHRQDLRITELSYFMWRNPTAANRSAYAALLPLNLLTDGRFADEIALVARPGASATA